jgi:hypothetical protein
LKKTKNLTILSIVNGKAINKRDDQIFYFCKYEMLPIATGGFNGKIPELTIKD